MRPTLTRLLSVAVFGAVVGIASTGSAAPSGAVGVVRPRSAASAGAAAPTATAHACLARPSKLPPVLVVADVSRLGPEQQLTFAALEGIVNATGPRIYLEGERTDTTSATWLADGVVPMATRIVAPYALLTRFRSSIRGLVIWDPRRPEDTEDVATTVAGVEHLLPVSPAMATVLEGAPWHFRVGLDLRTLHLATRAQIYDWALARFGPPRTRVLAWLGGPDNGLRDLLVACRAFVFQADPERDALLVAKILGRYPALTPVFGYPCLDDEILKATGIPVCEPVGVSEISLSGKFLIPSDLSTNLSVHAAFAPVPTRPRWDDRAVTPDPTKTYVTFVISDGDNVGYDEEYLRSTQWVDPAHGSIPMGISVSPWLAVYAPRIYEYYVEHMTPDDAFVAGPSGAGYAYPGLDPELPAYLALTKTLMDRAGLRAVWILDNAYLASPSAAVVSQYVQALHPSGIFANYLGLLRPDPPAVSFSGSVPVVHAVWGDGVPLTEASIPLAAQAFPGRPAFVFVALDTWTMGFSSAEQVMADLGPDYVVVRPDRFIGLLKGAELAPRRH